MQPTPGDPVVREAPAADKLPWRLLVGLGFGVVGLVVLVGIGLYILVRAPSAPRGAVDSPAAGATITDPVDLYGWAVDLGARGNSGVDRVELYVDGAAIGDAHYGQNRPDLATSFGSQFQAAGWTTRLDPQHLAPGSHTLEVRARSKLTGSETSYTQAFIVRPATSPTGHLDVPEDGASVVGMTDVRGWAIDQRATDGSGVDRVQLYLDGLAMGQAQTGLNRPDIAASFGDQFVSAGWSARLDVHDLALGQHTLEARAHSSVSGDDTVYSRTIVLHPPTAPQGAIDSPADGTPVAGVTEVDGWAIDAGVSAGTGVDRVRLYVDGQLVGAADYGIVRAELGSAYGNAFTACGWTAQVDFSEQSAGQHVLEARAHSTLSGDETTYSANVVVSAQP